MPLYFQAVSIFDFDFLVLVLIRIKLIHNVTNVTIRDYERGKTIGNNSVKVMFTLN